MSHKFDHVLDFFSENMLSLDELLGNEELFEELFGIALTPKLLETLSGASLRTDQVSSFYTKALGNHEVNY